ncbi:MAG TPA: sugar transferase [Dinghuibacter sp.]|uniref:sugar transferase n=1 Tax=Dinghuibacter sp. TaxID=2024697 RepID=UPI002D153419|nr:sugar transferase [Dinghuibacter sp.]HTJ11009.1 sugar transferase [Dinghuibacter sp.]
MKRPQPLAALDMIPIRLSDGVINDQKLKRPLDLLISFLAFILALPLIGLVAIVVKLTSKGPIWYTQERIGKGGKPFTMYKFRSMCQNAEENGPALATENDVRITITGRVLRKWRLDELPQLWNVLKGDMSLVGPRPERQHYIDKIVEKAPNYKRLLNIKPGLTSMGIVNYGYASNVAEMIDRQRYDQYYFENRSLGMDLAILARSVGVVLGRKGK